MAKIHGVAGEWARVYGVVIGLWPLFLAVALGGFFLSMTIFGYLEIGLLGLGIDFVFTYWSWLNGFKRTERFFIGAKGEEQVSEILKKLPDSYHVFNDFAIGRRHVDHVVVGPAGVFAIETKCWAAKVTLDDGHILVGGMIPDRSPLNQAKDEAKAVKTALLKEGWKGDVTALVVFASNTFVPKIADVQGTIVLNAAEIQKAFSSDRVVLSPSELKRLIMIIEARG